MMELSDLLFHLTCQVPLPRPLLPKLAPSLCFPEVASASRRSSTRISPIYGRAIGCVGIFSPSMDSSPAFDSEEATRVFTADEPGEIGRKARAQPVH